jgi:hypothetical protein
MKALSPLCLNGVSVVVETSFNSFRWYPSTASYHRVFDKNIWLTVSKRNSLAVSVRVKRAKSPFWIAYVSLYLQTAWGPFLLSVVKIVCCSFRTMVKLIWSSEKDLHPPGMEMTLIVILLILDERLYFHRFLLPVKLYCFGCSEIYRHGLVKCLNNGSLFSSSEMLLAQPSLSPHLVGAIFSSHMAYHDITHMSHLGPPAFPVSGSLWATVLTLYLSPVVSSRICILVP